MKNITLLLLVLLTAVGGAKARTSERVLWTPATASDIIVDVFENSTFRFEENDVIRIYLTVPSNSDGVSYQLRYSTDGRNFSKLQAGEWPWIGSGNAYGEVTLSSADIAALNVENTKLYFGYNGGEANINKITVVSNETGEEKTLWSGLEFGTSIVNSFVAGDKIRVYCTVPSGGASFMIIYKGPKGNWEEKHLDNASNGYPWLNAEDSYKEISLSASDITKLKDNNNLYIGAYNMLSIDKISLITETAESSTLWTGSTEFNNNWSVGVSVSGQPGAKKHDVIRGTITATEGATVQVCDKNWSSFSDGDSEKIIESKSGEQTFDYEITSVAVLEYIQNNGLVIKGNAGTLSKIELLTYADSYDAVSVTIGEERIATWSHSKNLDFTGTGIMAYYASAVDKGTVTLANTATTWNNCGYILKGNEGTYEVKVVDDKHATYPSDTYLKAQVSDGTVAASTTGQYHYIFAKDEGGNIGFYKLTANHNLAAHRAYLETTEDITPTEATGARVALAFDDGEITGIQSVRKQTINDNVYYTLSGQRVAQPTKGLYIVNGKKVVIK